MSELSRRNFIPTAAAGLAAGAMLVGRPDPAAATIETVDGWRTRYSPVIDVTAHGASGNDTGNDAAAIQTAIDSAGFFGGGVVYFPPGTYRIGSALRIPDDVTLLGASGTGDSRSDFSGLSELKSTSSFGGNMIENANPTDGNSNIQVRNLRIFGPFGGAGRSISFRAAGGHGVRHARIENCQIWRGGVQWLRVRVSWFANNMVGGEGGLSNTALDLQGSDNIITGNQITTDPVNPTQPGIKVLWSTGCVIANNVIFFCSNNIVLEDTHRGQVVGNRIDSAWLDGIVVRSSVGGGSMSEAIVGNSFFNNGRNPALPEGAGIRLEGSSHHIVISGNVFGHEPAILPSGSDRQKYGVALTGTVHHNVIAGNSFENQAAGSIYTAPGVPANQEIGLNAG